MDHYATMSYQLAEQLTKRYSTSFSSSSSLFDATIRQHIYAIYGMVRLADEIVDTYRGSDALQQLDAFEQEVAQAVSIGYSTNPIVQAYALTAQTFSIQEDLTAPFFASMRSDIKPPKNRALTQAEYDAYIYGSAEVVGLMCLRVFVNGDTKLYTKLSPGARALGSAYQKINFLRDCAADYTTLGRSYFPGIESLDDLTESAKKAIVHDIRRELHVAEKAVQALPLTARKAVRLSFLYYSELLKRLDQTSAQTIRTHRIRVPTVKKVYLFVKARYL